MNRLSPARTLAYSLGNFAAGLYYAFNNFTLPLYLSLFTGNAILIGWLSSTRSFEQAVIQPLVGARSDRTWTRLGRRAPFFLIAMPIAALLLVINAHLARDPSLLWIVVVTIFLFSLSFNVGIDPYTALLADVTPSDQRGTVNGIKEVFGFVGQVVILIAATALWSTRPELIFYFVAAGLVLGFVIVALGVREQRDRLHFETKTVRRPMIIVNPRLRALTSVPILRSFLAFVLYVSALWRDQREASKLLAVKFLYQFGINAAVPFLTLFVVSEVGTRGWPELLSGLGLASSGLGGIDAAGLSQLMGAVLLLATALFAVPAGLLGDRFGKKKVFAFGLLIMGTFGMLAAFATTVPQLLIYLLLLGIGNAAQTVLFFPYLSDLVPTSRIGEFQGLSATAETGGVFLSILLAGELINLNLFGLHYRLVFIVTGVFILLGLVAVLFVKEKLIEVQRGELQPTPARP